MSGTTSIRCLVAVDEPGYEEILAWAALPAAGATVDSAALAGLLEMERIALAIRYQRGAAGGYARLQALWRYSDDYLAVRVDAAGTAYELDARDCPAPADGNPVNFVIPLINPGGASALIVRANEQGDAANPGTIRIRVNGRT